MPDLYGIEQDDAANPPPALCAVCEMVKEDGNLVSGLSPVGPVWVCEDCQCNSAKLRAFRDDVWGET